MLWSGLRTPKVLVANEPFKTKNTIDKERDNIKRTVLCLLFILTIIFPVASADLGAHHVIITDKYVYSEAKCSCGKGDWYQFNASCFLNYCPRCHKYGILAYEEGPESCTCPEGMWYCTHCDADYCCQCGKEHVIRTKYWLTPYKLNESEKSDILKKIGGT